MKNKNGKVIAIMGLWVFLTINKLIKVDSTTEHSGKEKPLGEESICVQPDSSSITVLSLYFYLIVVLLND